MAKRFAGGVILCLALTAPAWADTPTSAVIGTPPQPAWNSLSADQRTVLAPLSKEWDNMENFRKKKWLGIAERYARMTPDEQQRVQKRMRDWATMTPEQRNKVRDSYKEFTQLPPEKKQAVKQKWEKYSNLPEEEKNRIKQGKAAVTTPAAPLSQPAATTPTADQSAAPATAMPSATAAQPKP